MTLNTGLTAHDQYTADGGMSSEDTLDHSRHVLQESLRRFREGMCGEWRMTFWSKEARDEKHHPGWKGQLPGRR